MNLTNHFIIGIVQLNMLLRDTLEYMVPNREFTVENYDRRKEGFTALLAPNSPLSRFLKVNEDKENKIRDNFNNFFGDVYGDNARIVRKIDEKIEVDNAFHNELYEMVLGLFQTVEDITYGYLKHAKDKGEEDPALVDAVYKNEAYFRSLANFTITHDIIARFNEFQQASRSAQGQPSPVVNFISGEIQKLTNFLAFQRQHSKVKEVSYNESVDKINVLVESISGKRKLPEGISFPKLYEETQETLLKQLQIAENDFKISFAPVLKDYIETTKNIQEQAQKNNAENIQEKDLA